MMPSSFVVRNSKAASVGRSSCAFCFDGVLGVAWGRCGPELGEQLFWLCEFRWVQADGEGLVFACRDGVWPCCSATLGAMACAALACAAIFWDGCRGVALPGLRPVIVASRAIFGWPAGPRLPSAVSGGAGCGCDCVGGAWLGCDDGFDVCCGLLSACARGGRAASGHEHSALFGVRVGAERLERQLKLRQSPRGGSRSSRMGRWSRRNSTPDVFDIPAEAARRGWDEHDLMHFVFEHGVSQGLRMAEMFLVDADASSVVFQGGVL